MMQGVVYALFLCPKAESQACGGNADGQMSDLHTRFCLYVLMSECNYAIKDEGGARVFWRITVLPVRGDSRSSKNRLTDSVPDAEMDFWQRKGTVRMWHMTQLSVACAPLAKWAGCFR
jgi:hypothetical protein